MLPKLPIIALGLVFGERLIATARALAIVIKIASVRGITVRVAFTTAPTRGIAVNLEVAPVKDGNGSLDLGFDRFGNRGIFVVAYFGIGYGRASDNVGLFIACDIAKKRSMPQGNNFRL